MASGMVMDNTRTRSVTNFTSGSSGRAGRKVRGVSSTLMEAPMLANSKITYPTALESWSISTRISIWAISSKEVERERAGIFIARELSSRASGSIIIYPKESLYYSMATSSRELSKIMRDLKEYIGIEMGTSTKGLGRTMSNMALGG